MLTARLKQVWTSVADRGRQLLRLAPNGGAHRIDFLAADLLSERGEATNMARAEAIIRLYENLPKEERDGFHRYLAQNFLPDAECLKRAAEAYLAEPSAETARELALLSESPRQELIRRLNVAPGATVVLVRMREELLANKEERALLSPLEQDLRHLLASWFNRGFLELKRIDWNTSAAILEKLIAYEAVHEIRGWDDLRRRLAPDRRCFAFFHPALPEEPLIFVEVALCLGLAENIEPLLRIGAPSDDLTKADTAVFYSISTCQPGLRGISFGNFLIKQVVEELHAELPGLTKFGTLSPVPGFRRWLEKTLTAGGGALSEAERLAIRNVGADRAPSSNGTDWADLEGTDTRTKRLLLGLTASYLADANNGAGPQDPVARFHLGNGARLERVHWAANPSARGIAESIGMMVNYVYDPATIESNHEQFAKMGKVAHSREIAELLKRGARAEALKSAPRDPSVVVSADRTRIDRLTGDVEPQLP
jgi:malonyl-CoA decarboxylase